ncbi:MAG: DUF983 domain-containing protein [Flavobacteriales bacterium]|nr:DUF983 domain-containing protein [Flavobacteriales bacterium]
MKATRSRLGSVLALKCPYCREGDFFLSHPYDLRRAGDTPNACPQCGGRFSIEPGFYYGAMYVSYALTVAAAVACWVVLQVFAPGLSLHATVLAIIGVLVVGTPWFYALSKVIYANMFLPIKAFNSSRKPTDRAEAGRPG